jgi:hypothetical protein
LLHEQHSSRHQPLQQLLSDVLASADWVTLCHRLLPLLPDQGLRQVAHTLADDLHSPQQAQQQQQQGRQGGNSNIISLLACWCREQTTHSAQLAAAAAAAADGTAGVHQQQVLAALQAAATPAAQLACVTQPHMLLLGCLQSAQQGGLWVALVADLCSRLCCKGKNNYTVYALTHEHPGPNLGMRLCDATCQAGLPGGRSINVLCSWVGAPAVSSH